MTIPEKMAEPAHETPRAGPLQRGIENAMALCLGIMALAVFINVVLRYGFGSGINASEELSRLLFVWMVFIGATAAYPAGEHMAFTSLVGMSSRSVVLEYPVMLLPLPALLCAVAIGVMALLELLRGRPLDLGHAGEVE